MNKIINNELHTKQATKAGSSTENRNGRAMVGAIEVHPFPCAGNEWITIKMYRTDGKTKLRGETVVDKGSFDALCIEYLQSQGYIVALPIEAGK